MKSKTTLHRMFVLLITLISAIGANAQEAYANYTSSDMRLTFYYDNNRSSRTGTTYNLNTGDELPGWTGDGYFVTNVVFDPSFADARPTTTHHWFSSMSNLHSITGLNYLNTSEVTSMAYMFSNCTKLTSLGVSHFNTAKVTDMQYMFYGCQALKSLDVSHFNTAQVTDMQYMFYGCQALKSLDLRSFNTAKVTGMGYMLCSLTALTVLDLSSFNTAKVTNMSHLFSSDYDLETIYVGSGWSTAAVTESKDMFNLCIMLVGGQGTEQVSYKTDATYAHIDGGPSNPGYFTDINGPRPYACYTSSNKTLTFYYDNQRSSRTGTTYDLNRVTEMPGWYDDGTNASTTKVVFKSSFANAHPKTTFMWFYNMENLQSITGLSYLNTRKVSSMAYMFSNCTKLTSLDVSHFNTSLVNDMDSLFANCTSLTTLDLSSWETSHVYRFSSMFSSCKGLTSLDLSSFNTSHASYMDSMFSECTNLKTIFVGNGWSTDILVESASMFNLCTSLVGGQGTKYNASNPTDKTYAHVDGGMSNPGYLTAVTKAYAIYTSENTSLTFYYDDQFAFRTGTIYDLNTGTSNPGWFTDNTSLKVTKAVFDPSFADARPTTTYAWFSSMANLQSITGLNYLNTSEVTSMALMFYDCKLTSLDLSSFNTSKVTDMRHMFEYCRNLRTIFVGSGWSTAAVTGSDNMFNGCTSLVGEQGTTYDESHVNKTYARIDGGTGNPGYFSDPPEAYACYTSSNTTLTFYYDNLRDSRTGTTYSLKTEPVSQDWFTDKTNANVTRVVFDSSFAHARPTNTYGWFSKMENLRTISNIGHLNTSEVTSMASMFAICKSLTTLDLTHFNTGMVTDMRAMFSGCTNLQTIYVGDGWSTDNVTDTYSILMFDQCTSLEGGQGTKWKATNPSNKTYAHTDGGPSDPGYFTYRNTGITTDIGNVQRDAVKVQSEEWFTIDGQKLSGKPTKKGVYIYNGRAVVL